MNFGLCRLLRLAPRTRRTANPAPHCVVESAGLGIAERKADLCYGSLRLRQRTQRRLAPSVIEQARKTQPLRLQAPSKRAFSQAQHARSLSAGG